MTSLHLSLSELEIIGYADSLTEDLVPQVVPPIFRQLDAPDRVVMPPFSIEDEVVTGAEVGFESDFESALARGQATRLDTVIPARPDCRLWVDESFEPHYEPSEVVAGKLREIARSKARRAQQALIEGRMGEAMRLAQTAISADDGCLNAILVKALAHRLEGDQASVEVLTDVAETILPGADLRAWVDFFFALAQAHAARSLHEPTSPPAWLIAEAAPSYGARSEDLGWLHVGEGSDVDDPGSSREIAASLFSRYKILSEIDFELADNTEQMVI